MTTGPNQQIEDDESSNIQAFLIGAGVGIAVLTVVLIVLAVILALNAQNAAAPVEVIRDLLISTLALELVVVGVALTVFIVQVARLVNLLTNEIQPIITGTTDTVNTVKGTAIFLSKNLTEPVVSMMSTLRGVSKIMGDVEAIRKAAGIVGAAASAASVTGAHSTPSAGVDSPADEPPDAQGSDKPATEDDSPDHKGAGLAGTNANLSRLD